MIRLITLILSIIDQIFRSKERSEAITLGKVESIKEVNDAINANVAAADAAVSNLDAARLDRMRSRFDRSRSQ